MSKALFVIGFGGPSSKEEIRPFLDKVLAGRPVPQERYEEVVWQYESLGGASPYNRLAEDLAAALKERLAADGRPLPVYVGFRNAEPSVADALRRMASDGVTEAAGLILSSFRSEPSWDRYVAAVNEARAQVSGAPLVLPLSPWSDDALFLKSLTERISEAEASIPQDLRAEAHWLFTAHSIPMAADHPSRYAEQVRRTASRAADLLGHANWTLCFQSRSGRPEDPWLEPDVSEVLSAANHARSLEALVVPVGFLLDHVEVLYDLDVKARGAAEKSGLRFHRAKTVGAHPAFLELLSLRVSHALRLPAAQTQGAS